MRKGLKRQQPDPYEGVRLACTLNSIQKEIEATKALEQNSLLEKLWYKQQFAIGVNEVTRALERMSPATETGAPPQKPKAMSINRKLSPLRLQAILYASDSPGWLTKHLPELASTRKVPVIQVKDKRKGSLRLGELVKLKTVIAIGVKDKRNAINQIIKEILEEDNDIGAMRGDTRN